ncbi:MAG: hypothetical protein CMP10_10835 [Zetaproteobacteria bacterium]|nr:hypothetical protein [Pseudobdellovibrionaceae bacterium]|tara:strand:- start:336 stop:602 length:267 start_codon:yes stop_codon:yes gene_type:complete
MVGLSVYKQKINEIGVWIADFINFLSLYRWKKVRYDRASSGCGSYWLFDKKYKHHIINIDFGVLAANKNFLVKILRMIVVKFTTYYLK